MSTINAAEGYTLEIVDKLDRDGDAWVEILDEADAIDGGVYLNQESAEALIAHLSSLYELDVPVPGNVVKASEVSLNEALIRVAAAHNVAVTFKYSKSETSPIEYRTFVPRAVRNMGDHVTFVGEDNDRHGVRSFRSDRIKDTVQVIA
jgi:predicted DNA-binding transcriptional regulator YafY